MPSAQTHQSPELRRALQHELFDLAPMLKKGDAMTVISKAVSTSEGELYRMGVGRAVNRRGFYLGTKRDRRTGEVVMSNWRIRSRDVRAVIDELREGTFVAPPEESRQRRAA